VIELRGFLGLAGYYRRFINHFLILATQLTDLNKKTPEFRWTPRTQSSFEQIKDSIVRASVLVIHDTSPNARYTLYRDASGFAVGGVLSQDQGIGLQHVAYHARKMNKHEVENHVHEQELLAVRDVLLKFRCYLDDTAGFTDHDTLQHSFRQRDSSTRQVRWLQVLVNYQRHMDIVYKKGPFNHADTLSRLYGMKDSIHKLQLLRDSTNDGVGFQLHAIFSP
jgi:hypothetical protein